MSVLRARKLYSSLHKPLVSMSTLIDFHTISTTPNHAPSYSASHDLNNANSLFETLLQPNTLQWNKIIKAHVDAGFFTAALCLFSSMRAAYLHPDHYTFPLINRAIASIPRSINLGRATHCLGIKLGLSSDAYFCNTTIDMYFKCDSVSSATLVFDEMRDRDVVSWTSLISGYVRMGDVYESFMVFHKMRMAGLNPSPVTISVVARVCDDDADGGMQLHCLAIKSGLEMHELVRNSILTVYSLAGCFKEAAKMFSITVDKSVVSWNIMMTMYLLAGDVSMVVDCFESMMVDLLPSNETLTLVLSAWARSKDIRCGQKVHSYAVKSGCLDAVLHSSLIDFYAKCGELDSSVRLFDAVEARNSFTWSVLMWGFIHDGQYREVISLFRKMQVADFEPTADTLKVLIVSYTHLGALQLGKSVHAYLIRNKFNDVLDDTPLQTSLLNMYAKCGSIALARMCFDVMVVKDTIACSSMIEGYGIHGLGMKAMKLFYEMQVEGIKPNSVTFLNLLSACSHSGLLSESCDVFDYMTGRSGIEPELNHYTCMVDLLGRSGKLNEALELIKNMKTEPDGRIWGALLASCRTYSDVRIGSFAAQRILDLEPDNVGYHVVVSNIHAGHNTWYEAESIRKVMSEKDFRKMPGWSCIEVQRRAHMFVAGDRSHPQVQEIWQVLGCLTLKIKEDG